MRHRGFWPRSSRPARASGCLALGSVGESCSWPPPSPSRGPRIFDLQIALTAFEGGARELWTADSKFVSVPGLPVVFPLAP
jgi:hypothetical protein